MAIHSTPPYVTTTSMLPRLRVVAALILDGDRCLATQRSRHKALPWKWEFPGGKVEPGETPEAALTREIFEEFSIPINVERLLTRAEVPSGDRLIVLDLYVVSRQDDTALTLHEHEAIRWLNAEQLNTLDWAGPDQPLLDPVRTLLMSL